MSLSETDVPKTGFIARYRRLLPWLVLGAVVTGGGLGLILHWQGVGANEVKSWGLGVPGDLFLRALKMVVVPLIVAAIVVGVSGAGDLRKVGK
ncbi:MAG: cation:dicarboxylase symporter family transporter, partial [Deltaproteobacteria bacterium]|nr:cation:dicarboxylase symporter family transporter [Deltaproteobacteria bacterium]